MKFLTALLTSFLISFSAFAFEVGETVQFPSIVGCVDREAALGASKEIEANGFDAEAFYQNEGCGDIPFGITGTLRERIYSFFDQNEGVVVGLWKVETPYKEVFYTWLFEIKGQEI